jgi:hypothetical protein
MPLDTVHGSLEAAGVALERADRDLRRLDELTRVLPDAANIRRSYDEVAHTYANWLIWTRMVAVAINAAGEAAGKPEVFTTWWDDIALDEHHAFFWDSRNLALKELAELIVDTPVRLDTGREVAYWAFDAGPFAAQPLLPRCQQYTNWVYDACLAPARELLWDWTRKELDAEDAAA